LPLVDDDDEPEADDRPVEKLPGGSEWYGKGTTAAPDGNTSSTGKAGLQE